ncbi:cation:proton antiporter [Actinoplanes sp. NPDC051411]|uniref:cation:proton antiporter n=1 Tax=Actinoplanes sp. NPDC051411 TaxID=3155522 RepID=UPI0034229F18
MTAGFGVLALIGAAGLLGPLLAARSAWHVPVVAGELVAGIVLGPSVSGLVEPADPTLSLLANVGFALVMFVAGSQVPIRDSRLRQALRTGALRAVLVGALAVLTAYGIARVTGIPHAALFAVLLASSSAALILPIVGALKLSGPEVLAMLPQVALADAACIIALPLVIDPGRAGTAALGAAAVIVASALLFAGLRLLDRRGLLRRAHRWSQRRKFAVELRISLILLFALAALAVTTHVSIMLAGFCFGLVVGAVGEPRRLAKQLFSVTDGFLGPLFFVWLGASLDVRSLNLVWLGVLLGAGAVAVHFVVRPGYAGLMASAQLGVPVAAATLGAATLRAGEPAAIMLGAVITIVVAVVAAGRLAAHQSKVPG